MKASSVKENRVISHCASNLGRIVDVLKCLSAILVSKYPKVSCDIKYTHKYANTKYLKDPFLIYVIQCDTYRMIIIIWWSTICFFVCLRRMIRIKWSTICSSTGIRWSQQCWEGQRRSPTAAEDRKWKYNILHFHFLSIHSNPDVEMASAGLRLPPRMPASNNSKGRRWTEDTPRPSFLNFRQNKQNNKHKY